MIKLRMQFLRLFLQFSLGIVFIFSGITKLFPIHLTELNLVYHHLANWTLSPYLSRFLIFIEILLGLALILGFYLKRVTIHLSLVFTSLLSLYLLILLYRDGNSQNCGCFGSVLPMSPIESLVKNVLIIAALLALLRISTSNYTKTANVIFILSSFISISLILYFFPIYTWLNVNPVPKKTVPFEFTEPVNSDQHQLIHLNEGNRLIAVFNTSCNNCREVAFKLGIVARQHKINNLFLILVGDKEEIKDFMLETHLNYPHKRYTFFEFVKKYPHGTWPWIIYSESGKIRKQWIYETFDVKNFMLQLK